MDEIKGNRGGDAGTKASFQVEAWLLSLARDGRRLEVKGPDSGGDMRGTCRGPSHLSFALTLLKIAC